ncbi:MAG: hypothetical protein JXA54_09680 [Candidatus Heimdallarchaeota archaeon]|nr:hypothetical protein [Candidatus Heimdallarchaeota archaeon]
MTHISIGIQLQILTLVQQSKKATITCVASITHLSEDEVIDIALNLPLKIEGKYLMAIQSEDMIDKKKVMTKEEYDTLNPKPAPTFCEAKRSKYAKY